ncbi:MAG: hypothetical protein AAF799_19310 [Myxococcota bacterium]
MSDIASIVRQTDDLLRSLILGAPSTGPGVPATRGLRRTRPEASEEHDQAPHPEFDGLPITVSGPQGEVQAVAMDVIPMESAQVRAEGDTIVIDFVFCDDYPRHLLEPVPGADHGVTRVLTHPMDPRRSLWMVQCLEVLYGSLGSDADGVDFDVDWISDRYETLVTDELTLPEGPAT